jgi:hypothetical protein
VAIGDGAQAGAGVLVVAGGAAVFAFALVVSEAGRQLRLAPFHFRLVGGRDMSGNKRERIEGCPLYPQKQTCSSSA